MQENPQNRRSFLKTLLNIGASFAGLQILTQNISHLSAQETDDLWNNNNLAIDNENQAAFFNLLSNLLSLPKGECSN